MRSILAVAAMTGRQLAAFAAALRPVAMVVWALGFGFFLGRAGRTWDDAGDALVYLAVGCLLALAERIYHRGHSGRIVGL